MLLRLGEKEEERRSRCKTSAQHRTAMSREASKIKLKVLAAQKKHERVS